MKEKILEYLKKHVDVSTASKMTDDLLDVIGISRSSILHGGDDLPENRMEKFDECQRIKDVLIKNGYVHAGLNDAMSLWYEFSDSYAANWLGLPDDDEELFNCIKYYILKIYVAE